MLQYVPAATGGGSSCASVHPVLEWSRSRPQTSQTMFRQHPQTTRADWRCPCSTPAKQRKLSLYPTLHPCASEEATKQKVNFQRLPLSILDPEVLQGRQQTTDYRQQTTDHRPQTTSVHKVGHSKRRRGKACLTCHMSPAGGTQHMQQLIVCTWKIQDDRPRR